MHRDTRHGWNGHIPPKTAQEHPSTIPLLTSTRDLRQGSTISCSPLRSTKRPLFHPNILPPPTHSPLLHSEACNLIQKNVNFSNDFIKAQNESNLIFSPSRKILFYSMYNCRKIYLVYNNAPGKQTEWWAALPCVPSKGYVFSVAHAHTLGRGCRHIYNCIYVWIIHVHINTDQSGRSVSRKYTNTLFKAELEFITWHREELIPESAKCAHWLTYQGRSTVPAV